MVNLESHINNLSLGVEKVKGEIEKIDRGVDSVLLADEDRDFIEKIKPIIADNNLPFVPVGDTIIPTCSSFDKIEESVFDLYDAIVDSDSESLSENVKNLLKGKKSDRSNKLLYDEIPDNFFDRKVLNYEFLLDLQNKKVKDFIQKGIIDNDGVIYTKDAKKKLGLGIKSDINAYFGRQEVSKEVREVTDLIGDIEGSMSAKAMLLVGIITGATLGGIAYIKSLDDERKPRTYDVRNFNHIKYLENVDGFEENVWIDDGIDLKDPRAGDTIRFFGDIENLTVIPYHNPFTGNERDYMSFVSLDDITHKPNDYSFSLYGNLTKNGFKVNDSVIINCEVGEYVSKYSKGRMEEIHTSLKGALNLENITHQKNKN